MNEKEERLIKSIEKEAQEFLNKHKFVPYEITVSKREYKIFKNALKQGKRPRINYNGIKWVVNVQCCETISPILKQEWGSV